MLPQLKRVLLPCVLVAILMPSLPIAADSETAPSDALPDLSGLHLRGIGPAVMGGRIADLAVDPRHDATWYVAVGSGGVWKTINAGTTWTPLFDDQPSYSIGVVRLDPTHPDTVWVGTGENVSGRHVGWGDGVYKSLDGGTTWQHMGLGASEHIGDIVIDPRNSDVVYVAAEGPLWSPGGERGLYKTVDGGESWERVLHVDDDTGITDIEMDPRHPEILYAASYERRRRVWSFLAGGPGSGLHKSTDGGATWRPLEHGLPKGDMGKIGLAVSPANPDVVYATIEASPEEQGLYRSRDNGETWQRRNSYVSGGTGPHYYQELFASPHDVDRIYQMDVFLHTSDDGGATMEKMVDGRQKHSDNHAFWIDPEDPRHLLAGSDGGLYETFDHGVTWRHFGNLPISQFYKLALDNASPFYNILGGAQDLGTLLGPSRNASHDGVLNRDWTIPMGADGYACAFDSEFPHLLYLQWQRGNLYRYDLRSHEALDIKPQPEPGDEPERWNWDSPLIESPHAAGRLYFGSQRLWRSDDRGNSWTAISGDLTHGGNRYELEMKDRVPSVDALFDQGAMSWYATLSALDESPLVEGLIYVGSDDGRIQVLEPGADTWRAAGDFPGVPERSFVQEVTASEHDPDTVFAVLDAHKIGDFRPFLLRSDDRGRTWTSITGDPDDGGLPNDSIVWSIEQDHMAEDLLFVGGEFGLHVSLDGGQQWQQMTSGIPTIALRDIVIQRRDSDLVMATFGRGFYVLDDYSPLRHLAMAGKKSAEEKSAETNTATLFPPRDAWSYVPQVPMQAKDQPSQGSAGFRAPNPPFGALLTYRLTESYKTPKQKRRATENELRDAGQDAPFPGRETLRDESLDQAPTVLLTVRDSDGQAVRRLRGPASAGLHRVAWDLRLPAPDPVNLQPVTFRPPWVEDPKGPLAAPGAYTVELALRQADGQVTSLAGPQSFEVKSVPGHSLGAPDAQKVAAFQDATRQLMRRVHGAAGDLGQAEARLRHLEEALHVTPNAADDLFPRFRTLKDTLNRLSTRLSGDRVRRGLSEPVSPSVMGRIFQLKFGHWDTRQEPTATQRRGLELAMSEFEELRQDLSRFLDEDLATFEAALEAAGAPWTPGRKP